MLGYVSVKIHAEDAESRVRLKELVEGLKLDTEQDVRAEAKAAEERVARRSKHEIQEVESLDLAQQKAEEALGQREQKEGEEKKKKYLEEYESYLKSDVYNKNNKALKGRPSKISQPIRIQTKAATSKISSSTLNKNKVIPTGGSKSKK